jgi:hypothetical protein
MYVQLDKEKPGIGNIRGLNFAAVKSAAVQIYLTAVSEG